MQPNKFIKKVRAYPLASHKAWEKQDKKSVLKMDWNESDIRLPQQVKKAVLDFVAHGPTHWYPDVANKTLLGAIADYANVPISYVQYFVGEDCALDYIVRAFVSPGDEVGLFAPTYDNFRVFVESVGAKPMHLVGKDIFKPDASAIARRISSRMSMVYLVNPNNPTGVLYSLNDVRTLLKSFPNILFVVDEAYFEFAGLSVVPLVKSYKNLIVGRSLSKAFGLASFRLGYIITDPENLEHINKIRNGKSISALAQIAAVAAFKHAGYMKAYVREMRRARRYMGMELRKMGFSVRETPANFLLIEVSDPAAFCAALEKKNVFVRNLGHLPSMSNYVRITVGTMKNSKKFLSIMHGLIKHGQIKNR